MKLFADWLTRVAERALWGFQQLLRERMDKTLVNFKWFYAMLRSALLGPINFSLGIASAPTLPSCSLCVWEWMWWAESVIISLPKAKPQLQLGPIYSLQLDLTRKWQAWLLLGNNLDTWIYWEGSAILMGLHATELVHFHLAFLYFIITFSWHYINHLPIS